MAFISDRKAYEKLILAFGVLVFLVYAFLYLPLNRELRELSAALEETLAELEEKGYGISQESIMENLRRVESEIGRLRDGDAPGDRTLESDPLISDRLDAPFQYFEYDRERSSIITQLRGLAAEHGVALAPEVIEELPEYVGQERDYLLWARLALANQVLRGAVVNGVDRVETLRFPRIRVVAGEERELYEEVMLAVRLTGDLEAVHPFLLYLVMDAAQSEAAGIPEAYPGKLPLYIDRFILRKKSIEEPGRVVADLVIKSFLKLD